MCICGISAKIKDIEQLRSCNKIDWNDISKRNTGKFLQQFGNTYNKGLRFKIKQNDIDKTVATLRGSLHKEGNKTTCSRFTHSDLCRTINKMHIDYGINPYSTKIRSIEIQINLFSCNIPASILMDKCLVHKQKPFADLNKFDPHFGKLATHDSYGVIFYNRNNLQGSGLLRYGVKIHKMKQIEKYGISYLSDLLEESKVYQLINELLEASKHVIFWDNTADTNGLSKCQIKRWLEIGDSNYWETANKHSSFNAKRSLKELSKKMNLPEYNNLLAEWIISEWNQLFNHSVIQHNSTIIKNGAHKGTTNAHIDKLCEGRPNKCSNDKSCSKTTPEIRICKSCGRDISKQRKGSVFCSAKYVGEKQAKQCRNMGRDRRNKK